MRVTGASANGVALADGTLIEADHVVIAAGAGATTRPMPPLFRGLVVAPDLHVRTRPAGSLILGADFGGSDPGADPEAVATGLLGALGDLLVLPKRPVLALWTVGRRPTPGDGALRSAGSGTGHLSR